MRLNLLTLILSLLFSTAITAQSIDWQQVTARYYAKYKPSKSPAWVFPLIFEEGGGQRDTLYSLYDEEARSLDGSDTIFGEKFLEMDSALFNARWYPGIYNNKSRKVNAFGDEIESMPIFFVNGALPLKIYWDKTLLNSSVLPFPDQSPRPRTQGEMWSDLPMVGSVGGKPCSYQIPMIMTDQPRSWTHCYGSDSLVYTDHMQRPGIGIGFLDFSIVPWTGTFQSVENEDPIFQDKIYPLPASDRLWIEMPRLAEYTLHLFDMNGRLVEELTTSSLVSEMETADKPSGLYLLSIKQADKVYRKVIAIQH